MGGSSVGARPPTSMSINYEVDDYEVATALSLNEYGGDDESS